MRRKSKKKIGQRKVREQIVTHSHKHTKEEKNRKQNTQGMETVQNPNVFLRKKYQRGEKGRTRD